MGAPRPDLMRIAEALDEAIRRSRLTYTEVCRRTGLHKVTLSRVKHGLIPVPKRHIPALSLLLGIPLSVFVEKIPTGDPGVEPAFLRSRRIGLWKASAVSGEHLTVPEALAPHPQAWAYRVGASALTRAGVQDGDLLVVSPSPARVGDLVVLPGGGGHLDARRVRYVEGRLGFAPESRGLPTLYPSDVAPLGVVTGLLRSYQVPDVRRTGVTSRDLVRIGEAVARAIQRHDLSQEEVSRRTGLNKVSLSRIVHGTIPVPERHRPALSNLLGIPVEFLERGEMGVEPAFFQTRVVPVWKAGKVTREELKVPDAVAPHPQAWAARLGGDAMEQAGLRDGDIVVVLPTSPRVGDVVALASGEGPIEARRVRYAQGKVCFVPESRAGHPVLYPPEAKPLGFVAGLLRSYQVPMDMPELPSRMSRGTREK